MEEYRIIEGFEKYSISDLGNVRNNKTARILKQATNMRYRQINIRGKTLYVHRLIALAFIPNIENKPTVDHIDKNESNNNVSNLRWANMSEQNLNKGVYINNISGCKGVAWIKDRKKWKAYITINRKTVILGLFKDLDDAKEARTKRVNELFREIII